MRRTHQNDQTGMVAIIVTMIMIFVITLIVIGFSEVTRRNQREALDTQLASQAYYAAETGVNDVITSVKHGATPSTTNCNPFAARSVTGASITLPRQLKPDNSVATTCLMVNPNPNSLFVQTISSSTDSVVWDVDDSGGSTFQTFTFKWAPDPALSSTTGTCNSAYNKYPKPSVWRAMAGASACKYALLRVDLVPYGTPLDATSLANANKTLYLKPSNTTTAAATLGVPSAYQFGCVSATCASGFTVNVSALGSSRFYMRLTTLYANATNVTLTATHTGGGQATFTNGQIIVDSTGRAQDQVKRIQVRVPLGQSSNIPVFGLQSATTICKQLKVRDASPWYTFYDKGPNCTPLWN